MVDYFPKLEPGIIYHVYNRGNNREDLYYTPGNYHYFMEKYFKYFSDWVDTYVYCLLPNHFHLMIKVKSVEDMMVTAGERSRTRARVDFPSLQDLESLAPHVVISELFRRFFMAYAKAINKQQDRVGSLFQKNFKRRAVNSSDYFTNLIYYIHTNPRLHGLCNDFRDWPYSSYQTMMLYNNTRLQRQLVLDWFGSKELYEASHLQYLDEKQLDPVRLED